MKRYLIILILPMILACGLLPSAAGFTAPTTTPLAATGAVPATQAEPQLIQEPSATSTALINVETFPNPYNYEWKQIAGGLTRPVEIQPANDGTNRLFIIEKPGRIRIYENGQTLPAAFLDITDRVDDSSNEMGLLGLAFHPDYEQNGYFYVNYTGEGGHTHISRFHAGGYTADPASEQALIIVEQPFPNHNGGGLAFGPDGYLYVALGDGGLAGDPYKNGQNTSSLLGKILRIDVNHGEKYAIPAGNPFGTEVWAYGLRNPWRISFDKASGDLWIGDVGQGAWEEIDYLPAGSAPGANFGWSIMEGNHGYDGEAQPGLLLPAVEYSHDFGCSVTGGFVYRGSMPEWQGIYLYGDYCTGNVWGLMNVNGEWQNQLLFEAVGNITSFGQDEDGEIYIASDSGDIFRLSAR